MKIELSLEVGLHPRNLAGLHRVEGIKEVHISEEYEGFKIYNEEGIAIMEGEGEREFHYALRDLHRETRERVRQSKD